MQDKFYIPQILKRDGDGRCI